MPTLQNITPDASLPTLLKIDGILMTECCCDGGSESSVSVSDGGWAGEGYYCWEFRTAYSPDASCDSLGAQATGCSYFETQEDFDLQGFGNCVCEDPDESGYIYCYGHFILSGPYETPEDCDAECGA